MAKRPLNETEEVENGENEEKGGKGRVRLVVKFSSDQSKGVSSSSSSLSSQSRVCCQVSDCGQDLGEVKGYYRKHKVCEYHAKAAVVSINGIDMRFCQQCSRFQEISEFDDTKRSCRKRLVGHNERRRKLCVDLQAEEKAVHIPSVPDVKDKSWRVRGHLEQAEEKAVHIPSVPDVKDKSWKVRGHLEHLTTRVQGKPSYMQFL